MRELARLCVDNLLSFRLVSAAGSNEDLAGRIEKILTKEKILLKQVRTDTANASASAAVLTVKTPASAAVLAT